MSEPEQAISHDSEEELEETPGYKPPAQKTLDEIQQLDAEDESLVRYKQTLLGAAAVAVSNTDGPNVVVKKLSLVVEGRDDVEIDLTGDLSKLKEKPIIIKEGIEFKLRITFQVTKEIVAGLRFRQTTFRKGIRMDKIALMVGSYGPRVEPHQFTTPADEAPKGMIARGHYTVKSKFFDDDQVSHLQWEWAFDIKKDWD